MSQDATNGKVIPIVRKPKYPFFTDLELADMPQPRAAIDGMLYCDTLATIVARYESFKTFVALEMAFCMAVGADFYGRKVAQGIVLYLTAEGSHGIARRIAALRAKYGGFTGEFPLIVHPGAVDICDPAVIATVLNDANRKLQEMTFAHEEIVAVFVDTLARNMVGDENSTADMNKFVAGMDMLRHRTGACVVAIHHTGWGETPRSRGAISLPGAMDTEITISRDDSRVTLKSTKAKDWERFDDLVLEASPMAGSLVFERVAPSSPRLSAGERRALEEVQHEPGLRSSEWEKATGLSDGTYNNARRRLLSLSYVKLTKGLYVATATGVLALGATCNRGAAEVQE